ncbi:hypothetical protein, partial [Ligilactobacillus ruminis]|uniref:hypothetical protein n=1 Tax=Ligilactobacillus ruminis TaxID=1623 RepID=UPI001CDA7AB3
RFMKNAYLTTAYACSSLSQKINKVSIQKNAGKPTILNRRFPTFYNHPLQRDDVMFWKNFKQSKNRY